MCKCPNWCRKKWLKVKIMKYCHGILISHCFFNRYPFQYIALVELSTKGFSTNTWWLCLLLSWASAMATQTLSTMKQRWILWQTERCLFHLNKGIHTNEHSRVRSNKIFPLPSWKGLEEYKEKDPIEHVLKVLKNDHKVSDADIEAINERVKVEVDESVQFAEESPWPDDNELLKDVYIQQDYPYIVDW